MGVAETAVGVGGAVGHALGRGATVKVKLELVGGLVEPNHHPGLSVPEAEGGHPLEPVAEGIGVVVDGPMGWGG